MMWGETPPTCLGCSSRAEIGSSMIHDGGDRRGGVTLLNGPRRVPLESSGRREHEGNSLMPYWSQWHYYQLRWTERSKSLTLTLPRVSSSPTQREKRWDVNISRKNVRKPFQWENEIIPVIRLHVWINVISPSLMWYVLFCSLIPCILQSVVSYSAPQIFVHLSRRAISQGKGFFLVCVFESSPWLIIITFNSPGWLAAFWSENQTCDVHHKA